MAFRGAPGNVTTPLTPKVGRPFPFSHDENELLQNFRRRAPNLISAWCPDREATDQWLFLAQHVGLPTRLLDWTDGALIGLYFAIQNFAIQKKGDQPVVWMLDPIALNRLSVDTPSDKLLGLTWIHPTDGSINIASENIGSAWTNHSGRLLLPTAIPVTHIHPRMTVQRSCFTAHGRSKSSLADQAPSVISRYEINPDNQAEMLDELRRVGISHSTLWPDLDGLAKELGDFY